METKHPQGHRCDYILIDGADWCDLRIMIINVSNLKSTTTIDILALATETAPESLLRQHLRPLPLTCRRAASWPGPTRAAACTAGDQRRRGSTDGGRSARTIGYPVRQ